LRGFAKPGCEERKLIKHLLTDFPLDFRIGHRLCLSLWAGTRLDLEPILAYSITAARSWRLRTPVCAFAALVGFDRDRVFYPMLVTVIATCYILFAAIGSSTPVHAAAAPFPTATA
jgi:hypothetical protein